MTIDTSYEVRLIPRHTWDALQRYVKDHLRPGDFLTAVLRDAEDKGVGRQTLAAARISAGGSDFSAWDGPNPGRGEREANGGACE